MNISKEVKVGVLALISGTMLYLGVNFLKGTDFFSQDNKFYVVYDKIEGLTVSSPVILNGFTIGRVEEIEILHDKANKLKVTLIVSEGIELGDSTQAVLSNLDLLGGKAIILRAGNNTKTFKGGEQLIGTVEQGISDIIAQKAIPVLSNIDSLTYKINAMVDVKMKNNIQQSIEHVEEATSNFAVASVQLKALIASNKSKLDNITSNLDEISSSVKVMMVDLKPAIKNFASLADSLNDLKLKQTVENTNKAMSNLASITEKIDSGKGTVGKVLNEKEMYDNINITIKDLDSLFNDMQAHPNRYIQFSVFGKKDKSAKKK